MSMTFRELNVGQADFDPLAVAFERVVNIIDTQAKDVAAAAIGRLFGGLADFSKIQAGEQPRA